jgi:hypothetical protein
MEAMAGGNAIPYEDVMWRAILTDSHFWIPAVVLLLGIALLVYLR